ncbi:cyclic nucleotide-binding protein, partial [Arthrospira platensis SPKY1]|nr:cyclic nucleotide-binding protein [Arthrospira platensis SPKY1]
GSHFGEIGILSGLPRSLRAEAQPGCKLAFIPNQAIISLIQKMEGPVEKILRSVISHLHNTTHHYIHEIVKQEKMALVGGMMNSIIHDFKNPFCLISLSTQLLQQKHPDAETQRI